jgi:cysteine synthase
MSSQDCRTSALKTCKERGVVLPTFEQLRNPLNAVPAEIQESLKEVDMQAPDPLNLFRLSWKNDVETGGFRETPNHVVLPSVLTGVDAPIVVMLGTHFPTGAHKVGATYWPIAGALIRGEFDPKTHHALWPSTGNYCRGGTFDCEVLGCPSIAVLPEGMSEERFTWLDSHKAEIHRTPGSESNVKEVFDKAEELSSKDPHVHVFNQFECFANPTFHYAVTGPALQEAAAQAEGKLFGFFATQGSAGILGSAEYLRTIYPRLLVGAGEALQCPTLLGNGYGSHRIEGIGDKHVPWILNPQNLDVVAAIDDETVVQTAQLWNEPEGHKLLRQEGVPEELVKLLPLFGYSGIANVIGCIKMAKLFQLNSKQTLVTVATDAMEMYRSHLDRLRQEHPFEMKDACMALGRWKAISVAHMEEMTYSSRRRLHNLKYFTWVEQRGKSTEELDEQWDDETYWARQFTPDENDKLIEQFNEDIRNI